MNPNGQKNILLFLFITTAKLALAQVSADTIFANWDFAEGLPSGWSQNVISSSGFAQWEYRGPETQPSLYVGARGSCAALSKPIQSYSQSNGFMIFDANYWDAPNGPCAISNFGTGPDPFPPSGYVAELITNSIDLSMAQGVFLSFNHQFRTLNFGQINTRVKVYVSIDDTTWTEVYNNGNVNESPIVTQSFANISSITNGQNNVRFKFSFEGNYYWWQLDDIIVYQPFANDIAVRNPKFLSPSDQLIPVASEYDQYPQSMPPQLTFSAEALNEGYQTQNVVKAEIKAIRNGTLLLTQNIPPTQGVNLLPLQNQIYQNSSSYTLPSTGHWDLIYRTFQIENDEAIENNRDTLDIEYTPFVLAKDEGPCENHFIQPQLYNNNKRRDANYYKITGFGSYCHGFQVGFDETTPAGTQVIGKIYSLNSNYELINSIAITDTISVNGAFINFPGEEKLMTIHFSTPPFLNTGQIYCFTVEEADSTHSFGVARSGKSREGSSVAFFDVFTEDVFFVDTNFTYTDTTFILNDTIFNDTAYTVIENSFDTTLVDFSLNFDTTIVRVTSALTSDKSFMIRGLLTSNSLTMGCTDSEAMNYNLNAVVDDSSCYYNPGCAISIALNFDENADFDDNSCVIPGCTDSTATNYLVHATEADSSCVYPVAGCTDPLADNFNPDAAIDDGSCLIYGCTDTLALNFEVSANADDGNCLYLGCLDSLACNFTPDADVNGDCTYAGCNDPIACNYDSEAGCNDNSCCYDSCYHFVITFSPDTADIPWVLSYGDTTLLSDNREQDLFTCNSNGCEYSVQLSATDSIEFLTFSFVRSDNSTEHNTSLSGVYSDTTIYFSLGGLIFGCTDSMAINYEPSASCADGTCVTFGCMDITAYNYLVNATFDDGSCIYAGCLDILANNFADSASIDNGSCLYFGCTDSLALNFDSEFNFNDGSCIYPLYGCTNPLSDNYNPYAQINDGSCITSGCTNPSAINFNPYANIDNNSCQIPGCMDSAATNFNPSANLNDGSCQYNPLCSLLGCTNSNACNFNIDANCDNGSCVFPGCTDIGACNYSATAGCDDSSCTFPGCLDSNATNYNASAGCPDASCNFSNCSDLSACNYDPTSTNNNNCIYPGAPCNDGYSSTGNDVFTSDCVCEGQVSSQFGCTDPDALNYNFNAIYDDESCISSAPSLISNSTIGCSPLSATVFASSTLPLNFECYWLLDDVVVDSTCSEIISFSNLEPALHVISFAVAYANPYTGNYLSDTSYSYIEVIQGAELPIVTYDPVNQYLVCANCENQIQWFYDGGAIEGSDVLFVGTNGIIANGQYEIIHTGMQGCISDTSSFYLTEASLQYNVNAGCSPLTIDVFSANVIIDGMSCDLIIDGELFQDNFFGSTEIVLIESGTHNVSQACSYGDSISLSTFTVEVYESFNPEIFYDTTAQIVTCLNAALFDSIAWVVDGNFMGSDNNVIANGIYFSCIGYGPGTCQSQNTLNINSVSVQETNESGFMIYPVPTKDFLSVLCNPAIVRSIIIDMQGREVARFTSDSILDLSSLSPGLYILKTETTTQTFQRPFEIAR
jgi:hypothetical protein